MGSKPAPTKTQPGEERKRKKKKTGKRVKRINLIAIHVFEIEAKRLYRNKWKIGFFFIYRRMSVCVGRENRRLLKVLC